MPDGGEKLTISEFAARAGCTTQRVSQLLRKSLKEFQVIENGRKYILSDALPMVLEAREKQGYRKSCETVSNSCETVSETVSNDEISELYAQLDGIQRENADLHAALADVRQQLTAAKAEAQKNLDMLNSMRPQVAADVLEIDRLRKELDKARDQSDSLRDDAAEARERAAVAKAERDAERKRADETAAQLVSITAALQTAQQQAADLTAALAASQALQAGQMRLAMHDGSGDQNGDGLHDGKRRGFFAKLFGKS